MYLYVRILVFIVCIFFKINIVKNSKRLNYFSKLVLVQINFSLKKIIFNLKFKFIHNFIFWIEITLKYFRKNLIKLK